MPELVLIRCADWAPPVRERARRILLRIVAGALAALRDGSDVPARRLAARLAVAAGGTGVRELARRAARELDPATAQLWTDAALRTMAAAGPDDVAVDTLLGGRLPMVRASGVTALRGAGRADEAARHLTDRSGLVWACARWLLAQAGGDPYATCPRGPRTSAGPPSGCSAHDAGSTSCGPRWP
ncbi:hypothetical protein [Streptomyces sp. NPDC003952]